MITSDTFRTTFPIEKSGKLLSHHDRLMLIGSCFTESIGQYITNNKFNTCINPSGILYNPVSVRQCLLSLTEQKQYSAEDLFYFNERWSSFNHHSDFSHPSEESCLSAINNSIISSSDFLKQAGFLFVTFGSAWIYRYKKTGEIVANCHKVPGKEFVRELLDTGQVETICSDILELTKLKYPELQIVFTVSPVRHLKDGAAGNQLSKANLITGIHNALRRYDRAYYFPAYEIMMDDLRDYRYYAKDMIHPSDLAVEYIWTLFCRTFMDDGTISLLREVRKIMLAVRHRPLFPSGTAMRNFARAQLEKIAELNHNHPEINFQDEVNHFSTFL
ncbi:MAG: GSCFA domain-containing protein [Bacteroidetes bacterium]|nr:GSCFA domain-containing protein [Bacteroidota bacterium]